MNNFYRCLFLAIYLIVSAKELNAQCTGGTLGAAITPTASWQSVGTTNINGNNYVTFTATAGFNDYFSF